MDILYEIIPNKDVNIFSEYHDDRHYSFVYKNPHYSLKIIKAEKAKKAETNNLELMQNPEDLTNF